MNTDTIAKFIKERRDSLRLRQEDLAEMSGVAIKTIHLIEQGQGNPSVKTLEKIADVLGLEITIHIKQTI